MAKKKQVIVSYKKEKKKKKRQQRLKKLRKVLKVVAIIAILFLGLDKYLLDILQMVPPEGLSGPYKVLYVVDGDTIAISIGGQEERVRFIGVDAPESVNYDESKNTPQGQVASDYTKSLLKGKSVYIETDVTLRDDYGRLLAYVYLDDGKTMVEDLLLSDGMAQTLTIQPNSKYAERFYLLQKRAQWDRTGFWQDDVF